MTATRLQFCARLRVTTHIASVAAHLYDQLADAPADDTDAIGFTIDLRGEGDDLALVINDDRSNGNVLNVESYVLTLADQTELTGLFSLHWSDTASERQVDGFSGGLLVIDLTKRMSLANISTHEIFRQIETSLKFDPAAETSGAFAR